MAFLSKAYKLYKLWIFRKTWKIRNRHNETVPRRIFPIDKVQVGNYSYGSLDVYTWGAQEEQLKIGSFVSIASGVKFLLGGNHRIDTLLTFPVKVKFLNEKREAASKGPIIIEDDVWIGMDAIILSGSKIGRGCVIGAGSVVSGEIPPYSIVVGNPCRVIKKRFESTIINKLIEVDFSSIPRKLFIDNIDIFYENLDEQVLEKFLSMLKYNEPISSDNFEKEGQKDGDK